MEQDTSDDEAVADLLRRKIAPMAIGGCTSRRAKSKQRGGRRKRRRQGPPSEWWYSFRIRVKKTGKRTGEFRDQNLPRRSWAWHHVAVSKGLEESDEGIFFLVRQFQVTELSFVEVG